MCVQTQNKSKDKATTRRINNDDSGPPTGGERYISIEVSRYHPADISQYSLGVVGREQVVRT